MMRRLIPEKPPVSRMASRRGRVVLLGLGDGGDGHARITLGDHFRLMGGSGPVHAAMRRVAVQVVREAEREGLCLDALDEDQIPAVQGIMARCVESARVGAGVR